MWKGERGVSRRRSRARRLRCRRRRAGSRASRAPSVRARPARWKLRVYCRPRVEGPHSRAEHSPPTKPPRAPATRRRTGLARLAPSVVHRARGAPKVRPLHHDCRPGTPRAPCGEKRSARVGEAPASRFRGGTHHRTVADGAMPTFSAASPEITPHEPVLSTEKTRSSYTPNT